MKHIKTYESRVSTPEYPKVGYYITLKIKSTYTNRFNEFLETHIAKIKRIVGGNYIYVDYIPNSNSDDYDNFFNIEEIELYSPTQEDLEVILAQNKFNL